MSILLADDTFNFKAGNTASVNSAALQAAINAAANDQTQLVLPQGRIQYDQTPALPAGFTGTINVVGLGARTTVLCPMGSADGLNFDFSITDPTKNGLEGGNFTVDTTGTTGLPWKFSWGAAGVPSLSSAVLCRLAGVYCVGGRGPVLEECWNGEFTDLFMFGSEQKWFTVDPGNVFGDGKSGPGTGPMLTIIGGVNNTFRDVRGAFFAQGAIAKSQRGAAGDPQGIYFINYSVVECIEGFHGYGTPNGNLSSIVFGGNLMIDNGDILVGANASMPGHRGIVFDNVEDSTIGAGQILQNGGDSLIIFNSCKRCSISSRLNLADRQNITGVPVQDNSGVGNTMPQVGASKLANISTRGFVGTGGDIMIAGFVIEGPVSKQVLIRASGPALAAFGVPGTLPDPKVELFSGTTVIAQNQGWGGSAQVTAIAAQVGAFAWTNPGSLDSAIVVTLQPGNYTAQVSGASGDTGDCLLEVYDVS